MDSSSAAFYQQQNTSSAICDLSSAANNLVTMNKRRPLSAEEVAESVRLKAIYEAKKSAARASGQSLTQADVAEACGWSGQSAFSQYATGKVPLNLEALLKLAKALDFSPEQVSTRLLSMVSLNSAPSEVVSDRSTDLVPMSIWDEDTPLDDDEVEVPYFAEVQLAAGSGMTHVVEVPGRKLRFSKATLREAGVNINDAMCARVHGRSMERMILDGAAVGVDRGQTEIIDGEIYAFDHEGMLRTKYLYRMPGGSVRARSENHEEYPDEIFTPEQMAEIRILGRVFWWSTVRRAPRRK
ncbi:LexA family transcriptional regulator [Pseudomonas sp. BIC9C]|uniref:LexA family transcriptional regulator n=1 Tax=Pseudomonas sp. BIC9C TaxID=3078458 RepID=UPI002AD1D0EA|nr:S24 family peptidase [Pseudomonas sp. BIC9C]